MKRLALALVALSLVHCGSDPEEAAVESPAPSPDGGAGDGAVGDAATEDGPPAATLEQIAEYTHAPHSCAYVCTGNCAEKTTTPYACPASADWDTLPHAAECPAYDKAPTVVAGQCTVGAPARQALEKVGASALTPGAYVLPDGRRLTPAGSEWVFADEVRGGYTSALAAVPGTPYVVTIDVGSRDHAVRVLDTRAFGGATSPAVSVLRPPNLGPSVAVGLPTDATHRVVWVATAYGKVLAFQLDTTTGALAADSASALTLPASTDQNGKPAGYTATSIALSGDGKRLLVGGAFDANAIVYDVDPADTANYGKQYGAVALGGSNVFAVAFDPNDAAGTRAYVTLWGSKKLLELDLTDPAAGQVAQQYAVGHDPEGIAFLDAKWMAVAGDLADAITLVDRVAHTTSEVRVDFDATLHGVDVSTLTWDATRHRLWATLAGINALEAWDVDLSPATPTLTPAGRLPTAWWPSGVVVHDDGALTIANLRGHGVGPIPLDTDQDSLPFGSVQHVAASAIDLTAGDLAVKASVAVGARDGYPTVTCPTGVKDFPVPATNTEGPSPSIDHILFIVRENKTFDSTFGDMTRLVESDANSPAVDGDAASALKATTADMEKVWPNLRALARAFTMSDNNYNLAMASSQGHTWTTYGRTTDFEERTWNDDARPVPLSGVAGIGRPEEGSLFDWLHTSGVSYDILGEIVGNPAIAQGDRNPVDGLYPGGPFQNISFVDLDKACHTAGRLRVACDMGSFVYMTLPNNHTIGVSPTNPTPETMIAVNDEATGLIVDAVSHSPYWKSTLIVITEDDPQQGGDHVDYHRTPLVLVSPWVKRGHVSKTHVDVASIHKLFAHVYGKPYPNLVVKNAGLPLDMFTSTPDFTPYTYTTHQWPLACGAGATAVEQRITESWDFTEVDEQSGLAAQVSRWMRGRQLGASAPAR